MTTRNRFPGWAVEMDGTFLGFREGDAMRAEIDAAETFDELRRIASAYGGRLVRMKPRERPKIPAIVRRARARTR